MNKPMFLSRKVGIAALVLFVIITGLVCVRRSMKGSNDFDTFYQAGQAVLQGTGIYYTGEYYQVDAKNSPFLYPPFAALFFAPWAILPIEFAAFLWNALNAGLFLMTFGLCLKLCGVRIQKAISLLRLESRPFILLMLIFVFSLLLDNLLMAQINTVVLSLSVLGLYLHSTQRNLAAGISIASAIMLKVTPVFLLLYFLLAKQWRVLAGVLIAMFFMTIVIPSIAFGPSLNILYHRQFLGRTIKPSAVQISSAFQNQETHPLKKSAAIYAHNHRGAMLLDKNQSLEASLTRLFLKNRPRYGYEPEPIYAARRYEGLPVLFGGINAHLLPWVIRFLQFIILGSISIFCCVPNKSQYQRLLIMALFIQTMTLLAPWVRSHQFISWIFTLCVLLIGAQQRIAPRVRYGLGLAGALYFLQAIPYGKAAGFGTWANLTLCGLCIVEFLSHFRDGHSSQCSKSINPHEDR